MAKKHKHPEHVNHERWLVSYADFITLLFAFFVVMFATSRSDDTKRKEISVAFSHALNDGVFRPTTALMPLNEPGPDEKSSLVGSPGHDSTSWSIEQDLEQALARLRTVQELRVRHEKRGAVVSLSEVGFYEPGIVQPDPESIEAIDGILAVANARGLPLRIEGHTDDTRADQSRTGALMLSAARAVWIAQRLLTVHHFPPRLLAVGAYGSFRPLVPNDGPLGRATNRRVDVVFLTDVEALEQEPPPAADEDEPPGSASDLVKALERPVVEAQDREGSGASPAPTAEPGHGAPSAEPARPEHPPEGAAPH
jgi:chemotaxis protein MotB